MKTRIKYRYKLVSPIRRVPAEKIVCTEAGERRYRWHEGWGTWIPVDENGNVPEDYHSAGSDF